MGQDRDVPSEPTPRHRTAPSLRSAVEPFQVMEVMRAALEREHMGERVVHMEVGQPGAPAPGPVLAAARAALVHGRLAYTEALGLRSLRSRIARYYADVHGLDVPYERIAVTTGSSAGFNLAFLAAFDHGDRIALAAPGYPAYRNLLHALGLEVVEIPVDGASRYVLTPEMLAAAHRERPLAGVLVASPANPSGTIMQPAALGGLIEAAHDLGIRFISDEIYHGLVYDGVAETALRFSPDAIVVNSFSKYYCMTGWRIGWMVLPEALVRPVERIAQNLYISPAEISQIAATAAFDATAELDVIKASYAENRRILRLCRDAALLERFRCLRPGDAARGGGRGDAGRRLRPRPRPRMDALLVRRHDAGHRGGDGPHRRLGPMRGAPGCAVGGRFGLALAGVAC